MSLSQPVRYPVKYYSHLDAGAPQLANADGVIKTILKACLVTGYGTKAGAGWTSLFDDANRIVLRRPLRTGNPPDIKIENGVINGTAKHRIVSQDNPSGLDDATEIAAVNISTRDTGFKPEWHLIACDFGFLLCYQVAYSAFNNNILYVGGAKALSSNGDSSGSDSFIVLRQANAGINGTGSAMRSMFNTEVSFYDMRFKLDIKDKHFLTLPVSELDFDSMYLAQRIIVGTRLELPFFCSIAGGFTDRSSSAVTVSNRPMLRYVNSVYDATNGRPLYIPLDYWEL